MISTEVEDWAAGAASPCCAARSTPTGAACPGPTRLRHSAVPAMPSAATSTANRFPLSTVDFPSSAGSATGSGRDEEGGHAQHDDGENRFGGDRQRERAGGRGDA